MSAAGSSAHEHSPEPPAHTRQHSQPPAHTHQHSQPPAARRIDIPCALSPGLRVCAKPAAEGGPGSDHSALSQSAPTSPFTMRQQPNGCAKSPPFLLIPPHHNGAPTLSRTTSPAPTTGIGARSNPDAAMQRARTGSIGAPRTRPFADHLLLRSSPHQRALSVQSPSSGSPTSLVHVAGLERASSSGSSRQSRRCSVAVSTHLSITQGMPVDPDRLDMDDDESDGYQSCDTHSDLGSADSMDLDPANDAASAGHRSLVSVARRTSRQTVVHEAGSAASTPRNKAFERLRSLVEEDKQALASEMEHEGQITRTIRHNSVQEWLRRSSSAGLSPAPPPPLLSGGSSPRATDDASSMASLLRGGASSKTVRPAPGLSQTDVLQPHETEDAHDPIGVPFPPPSPALSLASSPSMAATATPTTQISTPNGSSRTLATHTGLTTLCTPTPKRKRKAVDDDGDLTADEPATPHSYHNNKRQAMSPSGLRIQRGMNSNSKRMVLAPANSGPSSPLLASIQRPIAMPVLVRHQYSQQQNGSVGALSSMMGVVGNPALQNPAVLGGGGGGAQSPANRVRSRSGATPIGTSGGYYGGGANIMQANGVFSRMNISDKKQNHSSDNRPP
ncbi:hypothetical protein GGI23_000729 [Coemansia sp. RSA 2559]|nr:hypothetical protein GGI23_000729 [Coemansia sp. RSA 2559]KAJ2868815.1 hypothetical protein GGI22_000628 [Coemansia erecta]